jgi:histone-lysine N-methyltransferase SUV39H
LQYRTVLVYDQMLKATLPSKSDKSENKFTEYVENWVFRSYFFNLDKVQRQKFEQLEVEMSDKEKISIVIENDFDFSEFPPTFEYITENVFLDEFERTFVDDPADKLKVKGCKCNRKCGPNSECCPQLVGENFAYYEENKSTIIILDRNLPIIECNSYCKCDENCINRVTQQPRDITLCLFKTENKGWGVKNWNWKSTRNSTVADSLSNSVIKHGTFIMEYTGEMLGNQEAKRREVTSFLYDLNMDRESHGFYTIDAYKQGNLARFVNHSCEPNCFMWFINDCTQNPRNQ